MPRSEHEVYLWWVCNSPVPLQLSLKSGDKSCWGWRQKDVWDLSISHLESAKEDKMTVALISSLAFIPVIQRNDFWINAKCLLCLLLTLLFFLLWLLVIHLSWWDESARNGINKQTLTSYKIRCSKAYHGVWIFLDQQYLASHFLIHLRISCFIKCTGVTLELAGTWQKLLFSSMHRSLKSSLKTYGQSVKSEER